MAETGHEFIEESEINIEEALNAVEDGKAVRRSDWSEKTKHVRMMTVAATGEQVIGIEWLGGKRREVFEPSRMDRIKKWEFCDAD